MQNQLLARCSLRFGRAADGKIIAGREANLAVDFRSRPRCTKSSISRLVNAAGDGLQSFTLVVQNLVAPRHLLNVGDIVQRDQFAAEASAVAMVLLGSNRA